MKKILIPFIVCALALILVGCSAQGAATPEATAAAQSAEPTATEEILLGSCCASAAPTASFSGSCCDVSATATPAAVQGGSCCN